MALKVLLCAAALHSVAGDPVGTIQCCPPEVTAEVGSNVTLNCTVHPPCDVSNETVTWKFNNTPVHTWRSNMDDLDGQNIIFKNRTKPFPEEMSKGNVSLQLSNVNKEHEGTYTLSLKDSGLKTTVILRVVEPPKDKKHGGNTNNGTDAGNIIGGSVGAIVVGILGGIVFIALIAFGLYKRRKRFNCCAAEGPQSPRAGGFQDA